MPLRPYQTDTINNIYQSINNGHRHIVIQQPPRTGKTVIMAEIAKRATAKGNRVLTVVHRQELVEQTKRTFNDWGVDPELARVGMVQTLWRRVKKKGVDPPAIIIIDEAHHALAASYQTIINAFPNALVLMFTATPYRLSGAGMGEVADDLIPGLQVSELIEMGYLAPVRYFAPPDINAGLLRRQQGEFTSLSVENAIGKKIYGNAVVQYKKHASGLKAIAYCHSVDAAKRLAREFNVNGISALEVDGNTPIEQRAKAVEQFRNGDVTILTNVELFTEGLDLPNVDCVIQLRPTQSLGLYMQFAMRAMNPRPGKTAVIIDHVGNVTRFGQPTDDREWSLEGKTGSKESSPEGEKIEGTITCPNCFFTFYKNDAPNGLCPACSQPLPTSETDGLEVVNSELVELTDKTAVQRRLERVHKLQRQNAVKEIAGKTVNQFTTKREFDLYAKARGYKPGWAYYQAKERGII
ncbi:DEAD/DEAH box helicase [Lacticaseibacillus pantheris]|uniref:DEAD/DEAH box helicase n=1 Tax=Lacticaseibacillus pantheris TaxID=171523 RepID=UPI00265B0A62|nr:DEAD/DEAH box helicase [Lacticaseibacillus pantheris]WKF84462.1 DEAD/DEAH box helicase [Lacticaseibacillus pantheris]